MQVQSCRRSNKPSPMLTETEAREIARRVGKAALEFAATIVAPLYWVGRNPDGSLYTRNGTAFFLQTKDALFGVTAAHVIEGPRAGARTAKSMARQTFVLAAKLARLYPSNGMPAVSILISKWILPRSWCRRAKLSISTA